MCVCIYVYVNVVYVISIYIYIYILVRGKNRFTVFPRFFFSGLATIPQIKNREKTVVFFWGPRFSYGFSPNSVCARGVLTCLLVPPATLPAKRRPQTDGCQPRSFRRAAASGVPSCRQAAAGSVPALLALKICENPMKISENR